jgi:hypothetical protein
MHAAFSFVVIAPFLTASVEFQFIQVAPGPRAAPAFKRTPGQGRAVILLQGLYPHPFSDRRVSEARCLPWQRPGSALVVALAGDSDVFAFAYGQDVPVQRIARASGLGQGVRRLKELGYREIVLVAHSAGGLVARHLVEDEPDLGVTKVIQVCPPNGGASLAKAELAVRRRQEPFLESLTKQSRQQFLAKRVDKMIPEHVDFVVLMGQIKLELKGTAVLERADGAQPLKLTAEFDKQGDGLVSCACQWPSDLQAQGIPVVALGKDHFSILRGDDGVREIARLVREPQPRWKQDRVAEARRALIDD